MSKTDSYIEVGEALPVEQIIELMNSSGFFSGYSEDEINILSDWVSAYAIPAGEFIVKEGKGDNCLCIMVQGAVDIYKETDPDKHLKIASIVPHEPIGEMGVIDGEPFSASVITSTDSTVLIMTKSDFDTLTEKHETIGIKLLRKIAGIISSRLRSTTGRLADLLSNN
ncbi:MAG: Crp/Fnr family transcriptional regulator [Gammaproteobacteria bacterium]|nr:Crp/Fnr family transcriptional regulator [Gammaproteobacteria bacterium]